MLRLKIICKFDTVVMYSVAMLYSNIEVIRSAEYGICFCAKRLDIKLRIYFILKQNETYYV